MHCGSCASSTVSRLIPPPVSRLQTWSLLSVSLAAALTAAASAVGLSVSAVSAAIRDGRNLLTHCRFPDAVGYFGITDECPFDPTRIYVSHERAGCDL